MTTIAWDGKQFAADRQCSMFRSKTTKIHKLDDGRLFGSCGLLSDNQKVFRWLNAGGDQPKVDDNFHGILIGADASLSIIEKDLEFIIYERKFFAVGSGREYAMAAMYLNHSAYDAVLVAHEMDVDTGPEVDSLYLDLKS